ncbi:MAG: hypothetical protein P1U36_05535 [Legionellaceae bacterium]|nr:hypothetical protein [Legionellaceae bacterium]
MKFSSVTKKPSQLNKKISEKIANSKYYSLAPLHNKHKLTAVRDRYCDCFDVLFGEHRKDQPMRLGVLDYLTFGIFQVLRDMPSLGWLFRFLSVLKIGSAYILALPLMVIKILTTPLFVILDQILWFVLLNALFK